PKSALLHFQIIPSNDQSSITVRMVLYHLNNDSGLIVKQNSESRKAGGRRIAVPGQRHSKV
ncbi:MAG: hypothetical protein QMB90_11740, partial [Rubritalea sp.]